MDLLNLRGNSLRIFMDGIKNELFAFTDPPDRIIPLHLTDRTGKFQPDLLIRNMHLLRFLIIGKISQMDQQREHIIPVLKGDQVIGKSAGIHRNINAAEQLCDCRRQAVKIQTDIAHQIFRGRAFGPVGIKFIASNSFHDGIWIID